MNKTIDFNQLKTTTFPKVQTGDPPTTFVDLEHYRRWCGGSTYMYCVVGNYTRFNKDDKKLGGIIEQKTFRQRSTLYDIYSYSNFKYVYTDDPQFEQITRLYKNHHVNETGYWYGFDVLVHPSTGLTNYFMPLLDDNMMVNKLNIKLELRYRTWKLQEIKSMWPIMFLLMSVNITTKIGYCRKLVENNSHIPIEISHMIYQFAREPY